MYICDINYLKIFFYFLNIFDFNPIQYTQYTHLTIYNLLYAPLTIYHLLYTPLTIYHQLYLPLTIYFYF